MVRGWVKRKSVGSGREGRTLARQVFDETTSTRARLRQTERNMKMVMACLGRLNGAQGRLVVRWLGQRCWFHKWDMPMVCQVTREGERGMLASRFFRGGQRMWEVHDMVSVEIDKEGQQQYF
jgi:hypothetical protein